MSMSPSLRMPVHKALTQLRRERCLSQQQLADLAGVAIKTVWSMERGLTTYPTARTLGKLAAGLGLAEPDLRRRLGMSPPAGGGEIQREQRPAAVPPRVRNAAARVAVLTDALLARWETLTPAQQEYAETIFWHLCRALCVSPQAEPGQEESR